MISKNEDINSNNFKKNIAVFTACLIVAIGILVLFFSEHIFNLKNKVTNTTNNIHYFKWIILGFILNILFLIALSSMKSYKNNIIGETGPQGFRGKKGKKGSYGVICTGGGDNDFEYSFKGKGDKKYEFNEIFMKP